VERQTVLVEATAKGLIQASRCDMASSLDE
jgi:hypothetical protein